MSDNKTVLIHILGKEYQIACGPEEEAQLRQAAEMLDQQMSEIRDTGKVIGLERIAIMTALNMSHELLQVKGQSGQKNQAAEQCVQRVNQKLDAALNRLKQLEI